MKSSKAKDQAEKLEKLNSFLKSSELVEKYNSSEILLKNLRANSNALEGKIINYFKSDESNLREVLDYLFRGYHR